MAFRPEVVHFIFKIYFCGRLGTIEISINHTKLEVLKFLKKSIGQPMTEILYCYVKICTEFEYMSSEISLL
jgi:hypothetical protein